MPKRSWNTKQIQKYAWIGVLAVVIIAIAFYIWPSADKKESRISEQTHEQRSRAQIQEKLPAQKRAMIKPSAQNMQGRWLTKFGASGIAELTLQGQRFLLIYTNDPSGRARKYSKGTYLYDAEEGKLTLRPSSAAKPPKETQGISYKILTMRSYDIFLLQKPEERAIYWTAPEYQVISKNVHPLFLYADYKGAPVLKFAPVLGRER